MNNPGQMQPRPKSNSGLIAAIVGIPIVIGLGTLAFCASAMKHNLKAAEASVASAKSSAEKEGATFVPLLAKLSTDPKSLTPKTTKPGKDDVVYTYDDPKGTALHELKLTAEKKPNTWLIEFSAVSGVAAQDFAPSDTERAPPSSSEISALNDGPLKGAIVLRDASHWKLMSAAYALEKSVGGDETVDWICSTKRVPTIKSVDSGDFKVQCKDMVRAKLLVPTSADFPGLFDADRLLTNNKCGRTWRSWVDSKNAFGVKIRKTFTCTYEPSTSMVSFNFE